MSTTTQLPGRNNRKGGKTKIKLTGVVMVALTIVLLVLLCAFMFKHSQNLSMKIDELVSDNEHLQELLEEERKIDVTYVGNKLESISELTTAKMTYNGIIHFKEGKIPVITKKEFHMAYRVSMKAGFDLEKAEIKVTDNTVTINLPEAEIYEPTVHEDSFQYFDKSFAIFNPEKMDDLAQAISEAKADALAQPETQEMKIRAEEQAIVLITALLEGQIGERDLIINIG